MTPDLPSYWAMLEKSSIGWVHPDDRHALENVAHSFNLDFPPPAFVGNVTGAKIIVLAANGGYDAEVTPREFDAPDSEEQYLSRLKNPAGSDWSVVAPYYSGINYAELVFSGAAAIVNACAYRSPKISAESENKRVIKQLPSVALQRRWLIETVLPDANAGRRLIVGKRHGLWDLPDHVKSAVGFVADPAPVSKHLSKVVWDRVAEALV